MIEIYIRCAIPLGEAWYALRGLGTALRRDFLINGAKKLPKWGAFGFYQWFCLAKKATATAPGPAWVPMTLPTQV